MKRIYTIILSLAIALAAGIGSVQAQVVDVCAGNDSVVLKVGNFRYGYVQWQVSEDNELWSDIDGAIDTIYRFLPERPQYYRASVRFPACADSNYYSQVSYVQMPPKASAGPDLSIPAGMVARLNASAFKGATGEWHVIEGENGMVAESTNPKSCFIGDEGEYKLTWTVTNSCGSNTDTVTVRCVKMEYQPGIVYVDETDVILSDSTQLVNGEYVIVFSDPVPDIQEGSVLLGYRNPSFLRKVVSFERQGDLYVMQTEQGLLTDILLSGALCIDPIKDSDGNDKSSVKYIDRYPTRKEMLDNPFLMRDGCTYIVRNMIPKAEEKGDDWETTAEIEGGTISMGIKLNLGIWNDQLDGLIYDETVSLEPNLRANIEIDNGQLKECYYGYYDAVFSHTVSLSIDKALSAAGIGDHGTINATPIILGGFIIGAVPVTITLDFPVSFNISAAINGLKLSFTSSTTFTDAIEYNSQTHEFELKLFKGDPVDEPKELELNGTLGLKFQAGVKLSVLLAGVTGPYAELRGTVNPYICTSLTPPYHLSADLNLALDMDIGWRFHLFKDLLEKDICFNYKFFDHTEHAPKSITKFMGDNQVYTFGSYLEKPISVDAWGWFNTVLPYAKVYFEPEVGGEVSESEVTTDLNGRASTRWKPNNPFGRDRLKVKAYDCNGDLIGGTPIVFHAYSSATDPCINANMTVEALHVQEDRIIPQVHGGEKPFLYSTDGESYSDTQPTIQTQPGHNYTFYVQDKNGCEAMTTYNEPFCDCENSSLMLTVTASGNIINATAHFGFEPYWFSLDGVNYQPTGVFPLLLDGEYTVYVRDALGCVDTKHITVSREGNLSVWISDLDGNSGSAEVMNITENVVEKGICWSTHHEPTVEDLHVSYGPGTNYFQFTINGLDSEETYYVRAYALDPSGTSYSVEKCINPGDEEQNYLPDIFVTGITSVTPTSAVGSGNVIWAGSSEVTERGICWGTDHNPDVSGDHVPCGSGEGAFTTEITGLTPKTQYYARSYATNSYGTAYGEEKGFETHENGGGGSEVPEGVINGLFSVDKGIRVYFSKGNLQYRASINKWRFAERQWDFVGSQNPSNGDPGGTVNGSDNADISSNYAGWIDLFGWGTSGFNHGAVCYQPWSTSSNDNDYLAYGSPDYNLFDQSGQADWGYNAISNGGNQTGLWRTLSREEWMYLLTRNTESGMCFVKARLNGINGIVLLPDDWNADYYVFNNVNDDEADFSSNSITALSWSTLEQYGAVFLPISGYRFYSNQVVHVGDVGSYWTSGSFLWPGSPYLMHFNDWFISVDCINVHKREGMSVRLVYYTTPLGTIPEVTTYEASCFTSSTAFCNGNVLSDGGTNVKTRGICWSTSPNPTLNDNFSTSGKGEGGYRVMIPGLEPGLTYYVRAFATNAVGTAYGNEISFTTLSEGEVPEGAIDALFSIGEGQQVYFSKGNLQYHISSGTWWFADNQYDMIGEDNIYISPTYQGRIDLFAWGTSGWDHGAECYQPWSNSSSSGGNWSAYGCDTCNLYDYSGCADWGYNGINNGGSIINRWRTPSREEWHYLLFTRNTSSGIRFAKGKVSGINGLIILPDNWNSTFYLLNNTNQANSDYDSNIIDETQWNLLQQLGVVFLPSAGWRNPVSNYTTNISGVDLNGNYWSSSSGSYLKQKLFYDDGRLYVSDPNYYEYSESHGVFGYSVRLISSAQANPSIVSLPQVNTSVTDINCSRAVFVGNTVSDGGSEIIKRGFCWSTTHNPTIEGNHYSIDGGTDSFSIQVSGFSPETTYFVRAFTTNRAGIAYGNEVSFTTLSDGGVSAPTGAINGLFAVGDGQQVYFSQGNLQYIGSASSPYWKFAEHQWDCLGDNGQGSSSPFVDRDLFGWGTSGYNHGAVCYQPWSTSTNDSDYYAYGSDFYNLNDQTGQADWGYNAISNGGNTEHIWRTLTKEEWVYLTDNRITYSGIRYVIARVNGVNGIILFPDDWDASLFVFNNINNNDPYMLQNGFDDNVINFLQWGIMEQHGAVFIPASGGRVETSVYDVGTRGDYWLATNSDPERAWVFEIYDDLTIESYLQRLHGFAVRLVHSAPTSPLGQLPQVTMPDGVIVYLDNTAECYVEVVSDGGSAVTERGVCWSVDHNPTIYGSHASVGSGTGSFSYTISGLEANTTYYVRAYATNSVGTAYSDEVSFTTVPASNDHEYVDLGLPSGTLWATCNVGANAPEERGSFFAWGETQPKEYYDWSNYKYCDGSENTLTKYCDNPEYGYNGFVDNLNILETVDDAATVNWGDEWCIPSIEQWTELWQNTTEAWGYQNGVGGWCFTAPNGNSIFLPPGYNGGHIYGDWGVYYSNSLYEEYEPDPAWGFGFNEYGHFFYLSNRCDGRFVRPVRSTSPSSQLPQVTTSEVILESHFDEPGNWYMVATMGGTVSSDGGSPVTERGVCWGMNHDPSLNDNRVVCGDGIGDFSVDVMQSFSDGDYYVRAYAINDAGISYGNEVSFFVQNAGGQVDPILVPVGAINGLFSVSEGHRVFFSQGNLQYKASTNTWKFADNQWDYVGDGNVNVSDTYDGWIDLFGWGTSGYDHGADCYQPWCWVGNYYAYGDPSYNLNDQTGQADWGYNPIVNGGNQEAQWRTLTKEEWDYLINERNTPSGIRYAFAWVDGITGVVLLPDDWNASYHELNNVNTAAAFFTNQISYSQWQLMEQHGAVFLPAAGHRMNQPPEVGYLGICGYYWSATANGSGMAWYLGFSNAINTSAYLRLLGYSVRLVQDVPNSNDRNNGGEGRK